MFRSFICCCCCCCCSSNRCCSQRVSQWTAERARDSFLGPHSLQLSSAADNKWRWQQDRRRKKWGKSKKQRRACFAGCPAKKEKISEGEIERNRRQRCCFIAFSPDHLPAVQIFEEKEERRYFMLVESCFSQVLRTTRRFTDSNQTVNESSKYRSLTASALTLREAFFSSPPP